VISHTFIGVNDFAAAFRFYQAVLAPLGLELRFQDMARPWAGWQTPGQARPLFLIGAPHDGEAATVGNGAMVALLAQTRAAVDAAHAAGLAAGGKDEGAPGPRPHYHPDYYGAYLRDPDGNKIAIACHSAV
jgi:catechol 2,3-dioxygenase-like lactoylglutathione lyase family enzyme